ncbi:MAG: hypothetical protein M3O46_20440 [Myxococcota bacterium]|nr:hypothetical protein [Myxococcota bacterium]
MTARPMTARRFALARLARVLTPPLVLGLPPLLWVADATRRASLTTLGRDQGIFQYIAWALRCGAIDYRDIRDVNGPLTHLVHLLLLGLGGADEHRFRLVDLLVTGATFALVGACVPGLRSSRTPDGVERFAWALAGWVVLSAQYLLYGYWDLAQRESFLDWFLLPSLALQLVAQAPRRRPSTAERRAWLLVAVGALSVIPWFGKPTYALFTMAQLFGLALDDELVFSRQRALLAFGVGGVLGAATQVAFLVAYGDVRAFVHIQFTDVPAMYRFIWPRASADMFSDPWRATQAIFALVGAAVMFALICLGELPRRALAVTLAPLCALGSVVGQAKGFPYHFHPVTATVHLQWLVFAAWIADRSRVAQRRWAIVRLAPVAVAAAFSLRIATAMEDSPYVRAVWLLWGANTPEQRTTSEYFSRFPEPDFFPFELRQAANFVRRHTGTTDRVQTYGMDPYLLFLAGRQSATPYIYAYDLNADAALAGGTGGRPDDTQAARIRGIRDANEMDLLARLEARPPAAFVFIDGSPLISEVDAWTDFERHCTRTAAWVAAGYREAARFGHDHIWLRTEGVAGVPDESLPVVHRAAAQENPPSTP